MQIYPTSSSMMGSTQGNTASVQTTDSVKQADTASQTAQSQPAQQSQVNPVSSAAVAEVTGKGLNLDVRG